MNNDENPLKANFKIKLFGGDVLLAESGDPILWQSVLRAITEGKSFIGSTADTPSPSNIKQDGANPSDPIEKFAKQIGVSAEEVLGACSPTQDSPYISLDVHTWGALRKRIPTQGAGAVANISIAATILALWIKTAKIDATITMKDCQAVLKTIDLEQTNPGRSINNTPWLQNKNGNITINPAKVDVAVELVKNYCTANTLLKAA